MKITVCGGTMTKRSLLPLRLDRGETNPARRRPGTAARWTRLWKIAGGRARSRKISGMREVVQLVTVGRYRLFPHPPDLHYSLRSFA